MYCYFRLIHSFYYYTQNVKIRNYISDQVYNTTNIILGYTSLSQLQKLLQFTSFNSIIELVKILHTNISTSIEMLIFAYPTVGVSVENLRWYSRVVTYYFTHLLLGVFVSCYVNVCHFTSLIILSKYHLDTLLLLFNLNPNIKNNIIYYCYLTLPPNFQPQ